MTEIRGDQSLCFARKLCTVQAEPRLHFQEALIENLFDLPVPASKIGQHHAQLASDSSPIERNDVLNELLHSTDIRA